jgi:hypothetical protein
MNCPLIVNFAGSLGTVDYFVPCECLKLCEYTKCQYRQCGFLIQFQSLGTTTTNTVNLVGKACGGSLPLVTNSTGELVTIANLTVGTIYRVYPTSINGILRGIVSSI